MKKKQGRLERQADSDDEETTDLKKVNTSLYSTCMLITVGSYWLLLWMRNQSLGKCDQTFQILDIRLFYKGR